MLELSTYVDKVRAFGYIGQRTVWMGDAQFQWHLKHSALLSMALCSLAPLLIVILYDLDI